MRRKLIITDLDRSLLRNDKTISDFSVEVIEKCRQKGNIISFATARPIRTTLNYMNIIKPEGVIFHNGAIVTANNKILSEHKIPSSITKDIIKKIEKEYPEATLSAEINDVIYTNFTAPEAYPHVKIDFNELPNFSADKIIVGTICPEQIKSLEKYKTEDLYLEINDGIYGFFMNKKASKWLGIIDLAEYFGIDLENTIAFGDDINDLTMIKNSGIGICMKNGLEEVKAVSDEICDDNENDGIAKWLEENIL
jgi:Cof subfamily protein (haloacid dehalogenase superfamily)